MLLVCVGGSYVACMWVGCIYVACACGWVVCCLCVGGSYVACVCGWVVRQRQDLIIDAPGVTS